MGRYDGQREYFEFYTSVRATHVAAGVQLRRVHSFSVSFRPKGKKGKNPLCPKAFTTSSEVARRNTGGPTARKVIETDFRVTAT
ncbi:hypothetical protein EVAR_95565_1 [Eumeta japonica]|uniref:Uncharacterized protein n=1 Tax=Eumeta variegata TaxID=151549 RepID=A0A4C2A1N0_EUMVA|nr:hypothetical protein EVAR_95565_1 [Eumeta japonica]